MSSRYWGLPPEMVDETRRWMPLILYHQSTSTRLQLKVSFSQTLVLLTRCIQEPTWPNWWAWFHEYGHTYEMYETALYEWEARRYGSFAERLEATRIQEAIARGEMQEVSARDKHTLEMLLADGWAIYCEYVAEGVFVLLRMQDTAVSHEAMKVSKSNK